MTRTRWIVTACLGALVVFVAANVTWRRFEVRQFYRSHLLLSAMNDVYDGASTNNSTAAREVFLRHIPIGSDEIHARVALKSEGIDCESQPSPEEGRLNCQALVPGLPGYTHWTIDLKFDHASQLTEANIAILNILL